MIYQNLLKNQNLVFYLYLVKKIKLIERIWIMLENLIKMIHKRILLFDQTIIQLKILMLIFFRNFEI